jgi:F0F1-type ATP synthase delta subunit
MGRFYGANDKKEHMMDIRATILARKYAQAFLNIFINQITPENYADLLTLESYLRNHRDAMVYFSLPHIALEEKLTLFDQLEATIKPSEPFKKLFETLIRHNRIMLAPEILIKIGEFYRERKNILHFDIDSSHELDTEAITSIKDFLARHTGKNIESQQYINHNLIAGLRLQSDALLWEYSVRKQIHELNKLIKTKRYH